MHGIKKQIVTGNKPLESEIDVKKAESYYKKVARINEIKNDFGFQNEVLQLTEDILLDNPDNYTLWNNRKKIISENYNSSDEQKNTLPSFLASECQLIEKCLIANPKSYSCWHQRQFCLALKVLTLSDNTKDISDIWNCELKLCTKFLRFDARNFHCWDHRRFVLANLLKLKKNVNINENNVTINDKNNENDATINGEEFYWKNELKFTETKIIENFSNFSAWHQRIHCIQNILTYRSENKETITIYETIENELQNFVENAIFTEPRDQSAWFYLHWLIFDLPFIPLESNNNLSVQGNSGFKNKEIDRITNRNGIFGYVSNEFPFPRTKNIDVPFETLNSQNVLKTIHTEKNYNIINTAENAGKSPVWDSRNISQLNQNEISSLDRTSELLEFHNENSNFNASINCKNNNQNVVEYVEIRREPIAYILVRFSHAIKNLRYLDPEEYELALCKEQTDTTKRRDLEMSIYIKINGQIYSSQLLCLYPISTNNTWIIRNLNLQQTWTSLDQEKLEFEICFNNTYNLNGKIPHIIITMDMDSTENLIIYPTLKELLCNLQNSDKNVLFPPTPQNDQYEKLLKNVLSMCQQLDAIEPNNKWSMLTQVYVHEQLWFRCGFQLKLLHILNNDSNKNDKNCFIEQNDLSQFLDTIYEFCHQLSNVDEYRKNYYSHLYLKINILVTILQLFLEEISYKTNLSDNKIKPPFKLVLKLKSLTPTFNTTINDEQMSVNINEGLISWSLWNIVMCVKTTDFGIICKKVLRWVLPNIQELEIISSKDSPLNITDFRFLDGCFSQLDTLIADNVGITNVDGLESCPNLEHLSLKKNNIKQIDALSSLNRLGEMFSSNPNRQTNISNFDCLNVNCANLKTLNLSQNPICSDVHYPELLYQKYPLLLGKIIDDE